MSKRNQYKDEWVRQNAIRKSVKFLKSTDADIIEHLEEVLKEKPFTAYIKELIRKDIK